MLHYDEYGNRENPTILLLHGAGVLDTFCQQYCFSQRYHLVVPHLPGAGKAAGEVYEPKKTVSRLFALLESLHKEKVGVIGHSLGAQIAVMLVSKRPDVFHFAVFLSAWVNPKPNRIQTYASLAGLSVKLLHLDWLLHLQAKYWHCTAEQAAYIEKYSKQITPQVYRSFFTNTLELSKLPAYWAVRVPMLSICGSKETRDMKASLALLAENPFCSTLTLQGARHDFPMRNADQLNPILSRFLSGMSTAKNGEKHT